MKGGPVLTPAVLPLFLYSYCSFLQYLLDMLQDICLSHLLFVGMIGVPKPIAPIFLHACPFYMLLFYETSCHF